ncbi:glycoside hydrolase [Rhizodiscina lignyota]|uniref:chitinase n=1 Tax=Rhizodiscina lignyota TaxID=1504668 RepID=A0A9P4ICQ5_9PEZI|nr:glycoside hydrolase [Rhizodiscina lignyota]
MYLFYPNCNGQFPTNVNCDVISHVFYAFAIVNSNGTVQLDPELDANGKAVPANKTCLSTLTNLRDSKHFHLKIILSFGGGSGSANFAAAASTPASRQTFVNTAKHLIDSHKFNGIDLDWEYPSTPQEGANFVLLLQALRSVLPAKLYIMSAAFSNGAWALQNINLAAAAQSLDLMNIMTYDFSGSWTPTAGYQSQLYDPAHLNDPTQGLSCQTAVTYFRSKGVAANKLLLGVPIYGRSFLGATKAGDKYTGSGGNEGTFDYKDLPRPGTKEQVDSKAVAAYCVGGDGGFVSYDNPETVLMKAKYVRENGLAGLFYWSGSSDATGARSLAMAGYSALHS